MPPPPQESARPALRVQALFGGRGGATRAKQAMICLDCGYIYDDATPFASLPSSYRCPVCRRCVCLMNVSTSQAPRLCNSPKRRFGPYSEPVPRNANDLKVRKARKAKLQGGGGEGAGLDAYAC